ncbi:hypothetical protein N8T08_001733 [Aspergillus melleus]|uniref:Uncharacterized protein n=1 Tax=Aspergillus melleus TaxID=138277 RepID=A0ACC3AMV6_9EURO|nr:hypothetical protein N8T08_001733 [Aspergillus melleus]
MTRSTDIEKPNDQAFTAHDEYAGGHALAVLTAPVRYDTGQLRDITKSPYVFGPALLASSGGFSFGYDWYVLSYSMSYGPFAWVLPAEVFPSSKRAKGVGAATAMIWLSNFIISVVVPEMLIKLGWDTYLFFGMFFLGAAVFSYIFVPENPQSVTGASGRALWRQHARGQA